MGIWNSILGRVVRAAMLLPLVRTLLPTPLLLLPSNLLAS